jgi:hypothetical protein
VTRASTELRCFHVLDRAIGDLRADQDVGESGKAEEPGQPPQRRPAVDCGICQPLLNMPLPQVNANRDQRQAREEDRREKQKQNNSYISVGVTMNLQRKYEKPGDSRGGDQRYPHHAQPVASKNKPRRSGSSWIHE